jgi:hypothetical protein
MSTPAIKKRLTAIANGCAEINAILVAADADAQSSAKANPMPVNLQFIYSAKNFSFAKLHLQSLQNYFDG